MAAQVEHVAFGAPPAAGKRVEETPGRLSLTGFSKAVKQPLVTDLLPNGVV
ncbi:hypothetical protein SALBM135S_07007 [Streptomyces alboniger]